MLQNSAMAKNRQRSSTWEIDKVEEKLAEIGQHKLEPEKSKSSIT
jgi:hypothetical protein